MQGLLRIDTPTRGYINTVEPLIQVLQVRRGSAACRDALQDRSACLPAPLKVDADAILVRSRMLVKHLFIRKLFSAVRM
jgi:hypothetical protein